MGLFTLSWQWWQCFGGDNSSWERLYSIQERRLFPWQDATHPPHRVGLTAIGVAPGDEELLPPEAAKPPGEPAGIEVTEVEHTPMGPFLKATCPKVPSLESNQQC